MLSRKSVSRVCERQGLYAFKSCDSFPNDVLPTKREVLQRLLHERTWRTRPAAVIVAAELAEHWNCCNVYCISLDGIVFRIQNLVKDFRKIESQPKKGKKEAVTNAIFENNVKEFLNDIEELFDIFCNDQKQQRELEELHELRMNENDFAFYEDQKGPRERKCFDVVEQPDQSDVNVNQKISKKQRKSTNKASISSVNDDMLLGYDSDSSRSDNSELSTSSHSDEDYSPPIYQTTKQQNRVSLKDLAMACERYEVSGNAGAAIASAVLKDFGIVHETNRQTDLFVRRRTRNKSKYNDTRCDHKLNDVSKGQTYVVSRSTLGRWRKKYREEMRQKEEAQCSP